MPVGSRSFWENYLESKHGTEETMKQRQARKILKGVHCGPRLKWKASTVAKAVLHPHSQPVYGISILRQFDHIYSEKMEELHKMLFASFCLPASVFEAGEYSFRSK